MSRATFLVLLVVASPALAEPDVVYELRAGVLQHDTDGLWSGDRDERGVDWNTEVQFSRGTFAGAGGIARPSVGVSLHSRGHTSHLYAGYLWERAFGERFFANVGLGVAWHTGRTETVDPDRKQLGTRWLFRVPIELGVELAEHHRVVLSFAHLSNAGLGDENEGMDSLGLRYSYKY